MRNRKPLWTHFALRIFLAELASQSDFISQRWVLGLSHLVRPTSFYLPHVWTRRCDHWEALTLVSPDFDRRLAPKLLIGAVLVWCFCRRVVSTKSPARGVMIFAHCQVSRVLLDFCCALSPTSARNAPQDQHVFESASPGDCGDLSIWFQVRTSEVLCASRLKGAQAAKFQIIAFLAAGVCTALPLLFVPVAPIPAIALTFHSAQPAQFSSTTEAFLIFRCFRQVS